MTKAKQDADIEKLEEVSEKTKVNKTAVIIDKKGINLD